MFDIGWGELLVIGIVALVVIGPKELPAVLRATGHWMGKVRRMASDFQDQFRDAMREAEMDDLKKKVDEMADTGNFTNFDPLGSVRKEVEALASDEPSKSQTPEPAPSTASADTGGTAAPAPNPDTKTEPTQNPKAGEGA